MRVSAATCCKVPDSGMRPPRGWRTSPSRSSPARPRESRPAPAPTWNWKRAHRRRRESSSSRRYGFFYGPGTWYTREGDIGDQVRQQQVPIIGEGQGVYSFVHIDDAAGATAAALECPPGAYNIVDGNPSPQHVWLPAFARAVGAPAPPRVSEEEALRASGSDAVYYATKLRGASNEKAGRELDFRPRPLEWILDRRSD